MATNPPADLMLTPLQGDPRPLEEWLTTFHLASVVVDPYTNESSWILDTASRIMRNFTGSSVRVNWVATCDADDARAFLGPLAEEFLTFVDPDRSFVKALDLATLPAFVFLRIDGTVTAQAEGWDPVAWRTVADTMALATSWSSLQLPGPGDPAAFRGTPALA